MKNYVIGEVVNNDSVDVILIKQMVILQNRSWYKSRFPTSQQNFLFFFFFSISKMNLFFKLFEHNFWTEHPAFISLKYSSLPSWKLFKTCPTGACSKNSLAYYIPLYPYARFCQSIFHQIGHFSLCILMNVLLIPLLFISNYFSSFFPPLPSKVKMQYVQILHIIDTSINVQFQVNSFTW